MTNQHSNKRKRQQVQENCVHDQMTEGDGFPMTSENWCIVFENLGLQRKGFCTKHIINQIIFHAFITITGIPYIASLHKVSLILVYEPP